MVNTPGKMVEEHRGIKTTLKSRASHRRCFRFDDSFLRHSCMSAVMISRAVHFTKVERNRYGI
jgi:hypothetical protein